MVGAQALGRPSTSGLHGLLHPQVDPFAPVTLVQPLRPPSPSTPPASPSPGRRTERTRYPLRAATALAFAQRRWGRRNHRNLAAKGKHRNKKRVTNDPTISPTNTRDSPSSCSGSSLIFLFLLSLPHILEEDRAALRGSAPLGGSSFPGIRTWPMSCPGFTLHTCGRK